MGPVIINTHTLRYLLRASPSASTVEPPVQGMANDHSKKTKKKKKVDWPCFRPSGSLPLAQLSLTN